MNLDFEPLIFTTYKFLFGQRHDQVTPNGPEFCPGGLNCNKTWCKRNFSCRGSETINHGYYSFWSSIETISAQNYGLLHSLSFFLPFIRKKITLLRTCLSPVISPVVMECTGLHHWALYSSIIIQLSSSHAPRSFLKGLSKSLSYFTFIAANPSQSISEFFVYFRRNSK